MLRQILIVALFTISLYTSQAQSLYVPRNIEQAYKKGTRSPDGRPGKNYWQNHGRYDITVTAMPPNRTVSGSEQISYINNSPDTLRNLVIKLIVNIHKPEAARLRPANADYLTSGVHIDSLVVNGKAMPWRENPYRNTWNAIRLNQPLVSHDSVQLFIKWHYDASLQSGREGMIDSTTYFLAYCYPRISVYDDYNGWDTNEFNDALEFYNDFNDYTLNVRVPKNYLVWATGTLQNPADVLQPKYLQRFTESLIADSIIHVATKEDLAAKQVTTQNAINTWQWKADDITDVAFGLSDHFVWDASSVLVDDAAKRRASVQAAYNDTAADFHYMVGFGRHALDWLSHNWPGIPYPFEKTTVFQGYAGMEYPMMANDETYDDTTFSKFVAEHEIAHTYMPFYMGINEAEYGFMDEGWATTFELLIGRSDMGKEKAENFYKQFRVNQWIHDPAAGEDLPIVTPGTSLNGVGLGNNEYGKPSLGYLAVKDMLGDELFKKCLHEYMAQWHGKHPIPWDFFNIFNTASGKNLNWFWSNWYFSNGYIDLAIKNVSKNNNGYAVVIQNIGGFAAPVDAVVNYADGTTDTLHQTAEIWHKNIKATTINIRTKKKVSTISLQGGIWMDADESNNKWIVK